MRSHVSALLAGLIALCVAAPAVASDVEAQVQAMQERMLQLEDRLDATQDRLESANQQIDAQQTLIDDAGIGESGSGLVDFIDTIELGGWISASWFYNTRRSDGRELNGISSGAVPIIPFKGDNNSFSLDQLWFEIERPVSEENRAGFRADLVYGKTAGLLSGDFGAGDGFSGNDFEMYQAYIQYLAPIGEGVQFNFGKFATVIGAEVVQSPYNFNITRGNVYQLFQPITHTGITASSTFGDVSGLIGLVNETRSFPARDIDINNNKALLWSLGWANDDSPVSGSFNGTWGSSDSGAGQDTPSGDNEMILDFILNYEPNELFSSYINVDFISTENSVAGSIGDVTGYGISAAGRMALTDRMGFALRGEWVDLDPDDVSKLRIWGLTGTMDYALTEKLTLKAELRYDSAVGGGSSDDVFFRSGGSSLGAPGSGISLSKDDQLIAGVEAIYTF